MPRATIRGPVLLQAAESLANHRIDPADRSDVETYWGLVFAAAHQHSGVEFRERSDSGLEAMARALDARLAHGWLAGDRLPSPQTVYTCSGEVHAFSVQNPVDEMLGGKPVGALWTSSMLPDGVSAWQRSEESEFPGQGRRRSCSTSARTTSITSMRSAASAITRGWSRTTRGACRATRSPWTGSGWRATSLPCT